MISYIKLTVQNINIILNAYFISLKSLQYRLSNNNCKISSLLLLLTIYMLYWMQYTYLLQ